MTQKPGGKAYLWEGPIIDHSIFMKDRRVNLTQASATNQLKPMKTEMSRYQFITLSKLLNTRM